MNLFEVYSSYDIEIVKAKGSALWDNNNHQYLDLYGGHAVISVGHSHPHYIEAITTQLQKIGFYSNAIKIDLQNQLAKKLGSISGYPDYRLFLCNSGAEANENAFKLASFYNNRKKIIAFKGSFHGRTSLAVAATDNATILAPVNENPNIVWLPLNETAALDAALNDEICAVIIEGIQGVGGVNIPSANFLQHLSAKCKEKNIILILDEVQSGYGRSGKFFAHQHSDIKPDLITIAKGMGNGFPVAGVLISPLFAAEKEMLGTTFGGNYLACAAALAVLEIIESEQLISNAEIQGNYLVHELKKLVGIKEIRSLGLMTGIEFNENCSTIRNRLLNNYRIFTGSSSNKNTLRILPALNITKTEIDHFINTLKTLLDN